MDITEVEDDKISIEHSVEDNMIYIMNRGTSDAYYVMNIKTYDQYVRRGRRAKQFDIDLEGILNEFI